MKIMLYMGCKALTFSSGIVSSFLKKKARVTNKTIKMRFPTENHNP
jgi:hypothetical protein